MERREFIRSIAVYSAGLSLMQYETLLAATGFLQDGPYNGPLLTRYINSTCALCSGGCGIRVRTVDDIPVKIDGNPVHPVSRGGLCPVGVSALSVLIHPDRVRQPMLRIGPRGSGEYKQISWTEAESLLVEKLTELKTDGQPEQLLFVDSRDRGPGFNLSRKFTYDFGSPNFYNIEDPTQAIASTLWGGSGTDVTYDLENARIIYCFGYAPFEAGSNPVYYAGLRNRMLTRPESEKGSIFVLDSRLSASAAKAERWIPVVPGTHGLLALGMMYLIIKERLYDQDVVDKYCYGFEDRNNRNGETIEGFKSIVLKNYYPSKISEKTGVPVDQIIWLARKFAATAGAVALSGSAVSQTSDGIYQTWAVMALNALCGRFGKPGGVGKGMPDPFGPLAAKKVSVKPIVAASPDEFPYQSGSGCIESLPDRILTATPYPITLAIFNGANPAYSSSQASRFRQALQNIPFSVVITTLANETSALADLVLPDCTFLEKHDLVLPSSDFSHPVVSLTQPVVPPLYDSRQSDDLIVSMGKTILDGKWKKWRDYSHYLQERVEELYSTNSGTLFSDQFKVSFESLLAERGWRRTEYHDLDEFKTKLSTTGGWWNPLRYDSAEQDGFISTSGKFYFDSKPFRSHLRSSGRSIDKLFQNVGLTPPGDAGYLLGSYRQLDIDEESQYPLALYLIELTTARGEGGRLATMADMVGYYLYKKWQSWVEMSPETAEKLGLHEHQVVTVESPHGKQQMPLVLNEGLVGSVAAIPAGLGKTGVNSFGVNVNQILFPARDLITGMAASAETRVKVYA